MEQVHYRCCRGTMVTTLPGATPQNEIAVTSADINRMQYSSEVGRGSLKGTELGELAGEWLGHVTTGLLTVSKKNRWVLTMAGMKYMSSAIIDEPEQRG